MTLLAIEKMRSCKECSHVVTYTYSEFSTYYCGRSEGKYISGQNKNPKVNVPKWCLLRKFNLIK